ncbi:MAG: LptF/LptG family permease, partial [Muribaculaceae bacterium]|nr:LptF/LptG family permease [Muribaculaceae bacterium]
PLAILLASLMVFGNLGERLELTAMKASGVSLLKIMSPLIIFLCFVAAGAYYFQDSILPKAQVKMFTLLFSMRQKSPELDIPEGSVYDQIDGYNLFVHRKDHSTGMLYDVLIYDVSNGYGNANIISADSGKLSFGDDKTHLLLSLYSGESFEDLKDSRSSSSSAGKLYRRETFDSKEILIPFDANFSRIDEGLLSNQFIGKNSAQLSATVDSINQRIDSVGYIYGKNLKNNPYFAIQPKYNYSDNGQSEKKVDAPITLEKVLNLDSIFNEGSLSSRRKILSLAKSKVNRAIQEYQYKADNMRAERLNIARHEIELQKKYTLALACLIFFFIGAPLGSIIRKGGLAVPIVISVLFFVIYYIIDNTGQKLGKEGVLYAWQGVWLSSAVLFPIGVFFTYKAINDSAVFNPDAYRNFFRKITGVQVARKVEIKEIIMDNISVDVARQKIDALRIMAQNFLARYPHRQSYIEYWLLGYNQADITEMSASLESTVEYLTNSRYGLLVNKLMDFPILRNLMLYHPMPIAKLGWIFIITFPIGIPVYLLGLKQQKNFKREIQSIINVCNQLDELLDKDNVDV